jgi:hypothetical protein
MPSFVITRKNGDSFTVYFDECDRHIVEGRSWCVIPDEGKRFYAYRTGKAAVLSRYADGRIRRALISMHREIMKPPAGMVVDHINHNCLDNRRSNLRIVTHRQNMLNAKPRSDGNGVSGVTWDKEFKKWRARAHVNGRRAHLGRFESKREAIKARAAAERKHYLCGPGIGALA